MTAESDNLEEEPKDRTKWVWLGMLAAIIIMVVVLAVAGRQEAAGRSEVRAKHILIQYDRNSAADRASAIELITELRQRILEGESFAKLAREYSDDAFSSARGGDLGYQPKGSFDEAFEKCVWETSIGELSDIVTTGHGLHLIIVVDRRLSDAEAYHRRLVEKVTSKDEDTTGADSIDTP